MPRALSRGDSHVLEAAAFFLLSSTGLTNAYDETTASALLADPLQSSCYGRGQLASGVCLGRIRMKQSSLRNVHTGKTKAKNGVHRQPSEYEESVFMEGKPPLSIASFSPSSS